MKQEDFFVVMVQKKNGSAKVSQEAYISYAEARQFIELRDGNPQPFTDYIFEADDGITYFIYRVSVNKK